MDVPLHRLATSCNTNNRGGFYIDKEPRGDWFYAVYDPDNGRHTARKLYYGLGKPTVRLPKRFARELYAYCLMLAKSK